MASDVCCLRVWVEPDLSVTFAKRSLPGRNYVRQKGKKIVSCAILAAWMKKEMDGMDFLLRLTMKSGASLPAGMLSSLQNITPSLASHSFSGTPARQTAPRRFRCFAPRKKVDPPSDSISQSTQLDIFKTTGRLTIAAEGTAECFVVPDSISLSFLVRETSASLNASLAAVVAKITEVRRLADSCNVSDENVYSDVIRSSAKTVEYRVSHEGGSDSNDDDSSGVCASRGHAKKRYRVSGVKTSHTAESVVRIYLEGPTAAEQFSKVSHSLFSAGFTCHEAPLYDSTTISAYSNAARAEACKNARLKVSSIVQALGEGSAVVLGPPVFITDRHGGDMQDEAWSSFLGNPGAMRSEVVNGPMPVEGKVEPEAADCIDDIASDVFVVPPLRISASVLVIFELLSPEKIVPVAYRLTNGGLKKVSQLPRGPG